MLCMFLESIAYANILSMHCYIINDKTELFICLTVNILSLPQEHLDKKVIKVAWKSPLIADTQNYKQMYTVLQVRALVKIIM